jgi:hypothetical protein
MPAHVLHELTCSDRWTPYERAGHTHHCAGHTHYCVILEAPLGVGSVFLHKKDTRECLSCPGYAAAEREGNHLK